MNLIGYAIAIVLFCSGFLVAANETHAEQKMSQTVGKWKYEAAGKEIEGPYLAFLPKATDTKAKPALLIYLHGAGYRGTDVTKLDEEELVKQIRQGRELEAIVLFPQVSTYWSGEQGAAFIDQTLKTYEGQFDPDRVYLTGESSGGGGAWEAAKLRADKLAALVPIATTIGRADGAKALVNLPTWAFHNVNDPYQSVEKSRTQVNAVREAGGKFIFLTEYTEKPGKQNAKGEWPNAHRHAWESAYRDPAVWEWLFRQRRTKPELALHPPPTTQPGVKQ